MTPRFGATVRELGAVWLAFTDGHGTWLQWLGDGGGQSDGAPRT